jgi:uncharacterized phage-associated protein
MSEVPAIVRPINSAFAVSNWLIDKNQTDQSELTPLKLQKILYFAQGWHLAYFDVPLFEDPIEAWKYGPVVSSVYFALGSRAKNKVIVNPIEGPVVQDGIYSLGFPKMQFPDDKAKEFMESVWKTYAKKKAWELVSITHTKGSPWEQVVNLPENRKLNADSEFYEESINAIIPIELMRLFFRSIRDQRESS